MADLAGAVVPHDAVPVQPVEPRLAWHDAVAALAYLHSGSNGKSMQAPPDWPALVQAQEPVVALPFCLGNYPQMVRNLQALLHATNAVSLRTPSAHALALPAALEWSKEISGKCQFPEALFAVSVLRLARHHEEADAMLREQRRNVPVQWQAAWANEQAALAWQLGRTGEAADLWKAQAPSAPVVFNLGMAKLFAGDRSEARQNLSKAATLLPEDSSWHHLAELYLALAGILKT